jgi:hypothetical protein
MWKLEARLWRVFPHTILLWPGCGTGAGASIGMQSDRRCLMILSGILWGKGLEIEGNEP